MADSTPTSHIPAAPAEDIGNHPHPHPSPRSPRPPAEQSGQPVQPLPGALPGIPSGLPPGYLGPGPPPRPNLGSALFLTAFFFFMSGGNNMPPPSIVVGPDGEVQHRMTELALAREYVGDYRTFLYSTEGNWTETAQPELLASSLIPPQYAYEPIRPFFTNISGFYREARTHPINLLSSSPSTPHFFTHVPIPNLNVSSSSSQSTVSKWNDTLAEELRGSFDWQAVSKWEMNLKERHVEATNYSDWNWIKGSASLFAGDVLSVDYNFYGLHFVPNGTYDLFGLPDGMRIDIRNVPRLCPEHHNQTRGIIMAELEKELRVQEDNLMLSEVRPDEYTMTKCPLLIHLTVPPLPHGTSPEDIALYEAELHDPSGIRLSLLRPPDYWEGIGLGGVVVADQCGWAFGIEGGTGIKIDDFWRRSINYAAFATASQLLVLFLLVRQMESTRTPSTLAKVSLWTIVIMAISDSWIFSAHVVVGIMSDNRTSLPMLVPGFLSLCTAVVFGPRYAVLLHRIQAPERFNTTPTTTLPAQVTNPATADSPPGTTAIPAAGAEEIPTPGGDLVNLWKNNPRARTFVGFMLVLVVFQIAFVPSFIPFLLFVFYSFWIPQIYRNARRGNNHTLDRGFVIGTAIGRLALPLYVFGCPENVFFIKGSNWVWGLVAWQWAQIVLLFAQERFGAAFFLPKNLAVQDTYNYHPLLPPSDPENPDMADKEKDKICSICMEHVDTQPGPSGEVLLGMNPRRAYALAPCHHLFHTKCLAQWLAIKTICPLCKRSLPPL